MDIIETKIKEVKILKPKVFGDSRGYFMETWRDEFFRKNIFDKPLVQDNQSSSTIGVLRGLCKQTAVLDTGGICSRFLRDERRSCICL